MRDDPEVIYEIDIDDTPDWDDPEVIREGDVMYDPELDRPGGRELLRTYGFVETSTGAWAWPQMK